MIQTNPCHIIQQNENKNNFMIQKKKIWHLFMIHSFTFNMKNIYQKKKKKKKKNLN